MSSLTEEHECSPTFNCVCLQLGRPPWWLFIIKATFNPEYGSALCAEKESWLERWSGVWKCNRCINKRPKFPPCPPVWFAAIHHSVCIGVIFPYSGYFNLVQDLCRLPPLETNHKADRGPAEWIWFPCWIGFAQASVIQQSCYYSSNSSIQNLPGSARPQTPAVSRRCTGVRQTDVWHSTWQTGLYERVLKAKTWRDNGADQSSVRDFQTNCQIIEAAKST